MKCLETRTRADGIKTRRYELEDGRRITTFEVPASVVKGVGLKKIQEAMQDWKRGEQRRTGSHARRKQIIEMLDQGIKITAIAHEVGCTDQRVRQIRKELDHERKRIKPTPVQREPRQVWPELRRDIQTKWSGGRSPFAV